MLDLSQAFHMSVLVPFNYFNDAVMEARSGKQKWSGWLFNSLHKLRKVKAWRCRKSCLELRCQPVGAPEPASLNAPCCSEHGTGFIYTNVNLQDIQQTFLPKMTYNKYICQKEEKR